MLTCDRCKNQERNAVYPMHVGRYESLLAYSDTPDESRYLRKERFDLCNDCLDKLKKLTDDFLKERTPA